MLSDLRFLDDVLDSPGLIDEEGGSLSPHENPSIHIFLAIRTVRSHDGFFGVRDQGKREVIFRYERVMFRLRIVRNTDYDYSRVNEDIVIISQVACLSGTTGRIIARVKVKDEFAAEKIFESDRLSVLGDSGEVRCWRASLRHGSVSHTNPLDRDAHEIGQEHRALLK